MRFTLIFSGLLLAGCAHGNVSGQRLPNECDRDRNVAVWPAGQLPSKDKLVGLYFSIVPSNAQSIFMDAAQKTENEVGNKNIEQLADTFYEKQVLGVEASCLINGERLSDLDAASYVENLSADLATIAGLRDAQRHHADFIIPSSRISNLTAKMTLIVLSASCSASKTPSIADKLSAIELQCSNP